MSRRRARYAVPLLAAALGLVVIGAPAVAAPSSAKTPPTCTTTPSSVVAGVQIADPACDFNGASYTGTYFTPSQNLIGQFSHTYTGILADGSAYRVEVPPRWNGTLVMFAHGFRGSGSVVWVDNPDLRSYFVDEGYAWAASSYDENGYDVGSGAIDTHDLLRAFRNISKEAHAPSQVIMSGLSMGGEITAVEIEAYRGDYAGAMPYCGVLGANTLFNYFLGANVTAAALTKTTISYPMSLAAGQAYAPTYQGLVQGELPTLGIVPGAGGTTFTTNLTPTGKLWADTVEQLSGGTRPGFASALSYWNSFGFAPLTQIPFLFGLYPGLTGGTVGYANGNVADNTATVYRFSNRTGPLGPVARRLNASVLRVAATATPSTNPAKTELPDVIGDPGIPVLSIHGIGDLFVPFSMDQIYGQLMADHGEAGLFVDRAIREVTHCGYTPTELAAGFSALVNWIHTGHRPAGDNITDPRVVAQLTFGCRFTDPVPGSHPEFVGVPCPAKRGPGGSH